MGCFSFRIWIVTRKIYSQMYRLSSARSDITIQLQRMDPFSLWSISLCFYLCVFVFALMKVLLCATFPSTRSLPLSHSPSLRSGAFVHRSPYVGRQTFAFWNEYALSMGRRRSFTLYKRAPANGLNNQSEFKELKMEISFSISTHWVVSTTVAHNILPFPIDLFRSFVRFFIISTHLICIRVRVFASAFLSNSILLRFRRNIQQLFRWNNQMYANQNPI